MNALYNDFIANPIASAAPTINNAGTNIGAIAANIGARAAPIEENIPIIPGIKLVIIKALAADIAFLRRFHPLPANFVRPFKKPLKSAILSGNHFICIKVLTAVTATFNALNPDIILPPNFKPIPNIIPESIPACFQINSKAPPISPSTILLIALNISTTKSIAPFIILMNVSGLNNKSAIPARPASSPPLDFKLSPSDFKPSDIPLVFSLILFHIDACDFNFFSDSLRCSSPCANLPSASSVSLADFFSSSDELGFSNIELTSAN